jgi:hypothetical protein
MTEEEFNTPHTGRGWIGVDLDSTLAYHTGWKHHTHIGEPIMPMVALVQELIKDGEDVRIFTARADILLQPPKVYEETIAAITAWCSKHIGRALPVTNRKDFQMVRLYDDRAIQVEANEGLLVGDQAYERGYLDGQDEQRRHTEAFSL